MTQGYLADRANLDFLQTIRTLVDPQDCRELFNFVRDTEGNGQVSLNELKRLVSRLNKI